MTDGKTRQKRNGPGGSGCFHAFCYFLRPAGAGGGLCVAEAGRRVLGARFPAKPCSFVSFAPSPGTFSAPRRRGLGARLPAKPCSSVSFTPSPGAFLALGRRRLGARILAKPCSSVSLAPSPGTFSAPRRRGLGARLPAKPCSSVSFTPSPGAFSENGSNLHSTSQKIDDRPAVLRSLSSISTAFNRNSWN